MIDFSKLPQMGEIKKPPMLSAQMRLYVGEPCYYCKRPMRGDMQRLRPTRDHYNRFKNDRKFVVICCFECNQLKGPMLGRDFEAKLASGELGVSYD